ncbi:TlpA family protein disulfide reductase [Pontibacter harenae]|uniref:TlpA family protein disulfide reductase n=1 Tax=Pontibacter harenae TaxID=2894083 RepID=UPI001E5A154A|nr:TlpA disulfide reductase family protein [Pontibacter harenae]MCC9168117.1 TlpA family protein disulfide reductase [Pontibacter harenae]
MLKPALAELMQFSLLANKVSQKQSTHAELMAEFIARTQDKSMVAFLQEAQRLQEARKNIGDGVAIIDNKEVVTDLNSFLQLHRGKVIYVDLWASWCRPCLAEMPASQQLQQRYKGRDVLFLYLSLDEHKESWSKALVRQKDVLSNDNSYLLLDNFHSDFATKYDVKTIPRYLLIDKAGTVVETDAPRPGEEEVKELIDTYLAK